MLIKKQQKTRKTQKNSVKSVKSVDKKAENNKSAFYSKINGFLFGSFKNNRYLCKQKETTLYIIKNRAATYKRHKDYEERFSRNRKREWIAVD